MPTPDPAHDDGWEQIPVTDLGHVALARDDDGATLLLQVQVMADDGDVIASSVALTAGDAAWLAWSLLRVAARDAALAAVQRLLRQPAPPAGR